MGLPPLVARLLVARLLDARLLVARLLDAPAARSQALARTVLLSVCVTRRRLIFSWKFLCLHSAPTDLMFWDQRKTNTSLAAFLRDAKRTEESE